MYNNSLTELFRLIGLLGGSEGLSVREISQKMDVPLRTVYNNLNSLEQNGFTLLKTGTRYRVDPRSPFFRNIGASIPLTETEAEMVCRILATFDESNTIVLSAKDKLMRYYGFTSMASPDSQERRERKLDVINEAIVKKQMVLIKGYSSPHSSTTKDRIVEPFLVMNGGMDIRCHEISSRMNKTFKLSRMTDVELLDVSWIHEEAHRKVYTDLFMFSGEETHHVRLLMGQLSHNVMHEEYPRSERYFSQHDERRWLFETDVVSYLGIGRFVLGLYDDVEVLGDENFKTYLAEKIQKMQK